MLCNSGWIERKFKMRQRILETKKLWKLCIENPWKLWHRAQTQILHHQFCQYQVHFVWQGSQVKQFRGYFALRLICPFSWILLVVLWTLILTHCSPLTHSALTSLFHGPKYVNLSFFITATTTTRLESKVFSLEKYCLRPKSLFLDPKSLS